MSYLTKVDGEYRMCNKSTGTNIIMTAKQEMAKIVHYVHSQVSKSVGREYRNYEDELSGTDKLCFTCNVSCWNI